MRKLNREWFKHFWLRYSVKANGVYCAPCLLFAPAECKTKILVSTSLTDWSNLSKQIGKRKRKGLDILIFICKHY